MASVDATGQIVPSALRFRVGSTGTREPQDLHLPRPRYGGFAQARWQVIEVHAEAGEHSATNAGMRPVGATRLVDDQGPALTSVHRPYPAPADYFDDGDGVTVPLIVYAGNGISL
ncbi:hypothetical protein ACIA8K_29495 [Catenuloplanes sp. NPDC051500]|uniref:hypothetical protein n=1 Tax=Catenuloplanes sp. NPDC051500 TaxID=3363959 RepID=UPI003799913D